MTTGGRIRAVTLALTLVVATLAGVSAVPVATAATGVTDATVSPDSTSQGRTLDLSRSVVALGVDTSDGTTDATVTFGFSSEFDLSGASVTGATTNGSTTGASGALVDTDSDGSDDAVAVTFDDDGGSGAEDIAVSVSLTGVTAPGSVGDYDLSVSVDGDGDDTAEVTSPAAATFTVEDDESAPRPVEAVAFRTTGEAGLSGASAGDTLVEIRFDDPLDSGALAPDASDFRVRLSNRQHVIPASIAGEADGDSVVRLNLGSGVAPWNATRVNVTEGAGFADSAGNQVDATSGPINRTVIGASDTVEQGDASWSNPATVVQGGTIAVVASDPNTGVVLNSSETDFIFSGTTGEGSVVYLFDTAGRVSNETVTFGFESGGQPAITYRQLTLSLAADEVFIRDTDRLTGTVSANLGDRTIRVVMTDPDDEVETRWVVLDGSGEGAFDFGPQPIDGNYTLVAADAATGIAAVTDPVNVDADEAAASLRNETVVDERGDVVNLTVEVDETDTATVALGSPDIGYEANVTVTDGNDDETVVLQWNTFLADGSGAAFGVAPVETGDEPDSFVVENATSTVSGGLSGLLEPESYEVRIQPGAGSYAWGDPDDFAVVDLRERSTGALSTHAAPATRGDDLANPGDLLTERRGGNLTATDEVAVGDLLVVEFSASGLEGVIDAQSGANATARFFAAVGAGGAADLTVRQTDTGINRDPKLLVLGPANATAVLDPDNDTYTLVVDTARVRTASDTGAYGYDGETTSVRGADDVAWVVNATVLEHEGSLADAPQTVTANVTTVEREFSADPVTVTPTNATVRATTTFAPGTEVVVRVLGERGTGFGAQRTVHVDTGRSVETRVDFSPLTVGDAFSVRFSAEGVSETVDGSVVADAETTPTVTATATSTAITTSAVTPTPTATRTPTATATPTATRVPTTAATPTATPTTTEQSTPGFGALAALVALALMLVVAGRRR